MLAKRWLSLFHARRQPNFFGRGWVAKNKLAEHLLTSLGYA